MANRRPCKWKSYPRRSSTGKICSVCKGKLVVDNEEGCPFIWDYGINPKYQHLITAEERFYSISQLRKIEEIRQG